MINKKITPVLVFVFIVFGLMIFSTPAEAVYTKPCISTKTDAMKKEGKGSSPLQSTLTSAGFKKYIDYYAGEFRGPFRAACKGDLTEVKTSPAHVDLECGSAWYKKCDVKHFNCPESYFDYVIQEVRCKPTKNHGGQKYNCTKFSSAKKCKVSVGCAWVDSKCRSRETACKGMSIGTSCEVGGTDSRIGCFTDGGWCEDAGVEVTKGVMNYGGRNTHGATSYREECGGEERATRGIYNTEGCWEKEYNCRDGLDDNFDGRIDCADPSCQSKCSKYFNVTGEENREIKVEIDPLQAQGKIIKPLGNPHMYPPSRKYVTPMYADKQWSIQTDGLPYPKTNKEKFWVQSISGELDKDTTGEIKALTGEGKWIGDWMYSIKDMDWKCIRQSCWIAGMFCDCLEADWVPSTDGVHSDKINFSQDFNLGYYQTPNGPKSTAYPNQIPEIEQANLTFRLGNTNLICKNNDCDRKNWFDNVNVYIDGKLAGSKNPITPENENLVFSKNIVPLDVSKFSNANNHKITIEFITIDTNEVISSSMLLDSMWLELKKKNQDQYEVAVDTDSDGKWDYNNRTSSKAFITFENSGTDLVRVTKVTGSPDESGNVEVNITNMCQDNDGDTYANQTCGGLDCNDTDPSANINISCVDIFTPQPKYISKSGRKLIVPVEIQNQWTNEVKDIEISLSKISDFEGMSYKFEKCRGSVNCQNTGNKRVDFDIGAAPGPDQVSTGTIDLVFDIPGNVPPKSYKSEIKIEEA